MTCNAASQSNINLALALDLFIAICVVLEPHVGFLASLGKSAVPALHMHLLVLQAMLLLQMLTIAMHADRPSLACNEGSTRQCRTASDVNT